MERKRRAVADASLLVRRDATLPLCSDGNQTKVPFTRLREGHKLPIWHCVFEGCSACADNVAKGKSSEGELWHHITTTHALALSTIMWKHQLNDYIHSDLDKAEWMFALLIEALAFPTSLVDRIVCK